MNFDANEILNSIVALTSTWGLKVLGAILVLVVGRIVASSVRKLVHRGGQLYFNHALLVVIQSERGERLL